jgi:hypothetical protein
VGGARPLAVFAFREGQIGPFNVTATTAGTAQLVVAVALSKTFLPLNAGKLGVNFSTLLLQTGNVCHFFFRLGDSPSDSVGVASAEYVAPASGVRATPRLEIDLATLYAGGRLVEYLKLFAYAPGGGAPPHIDGYTLVVSGDPEPALPMADLPEEEMPDPLGTDIDVLTDLRPSFVLASGLTNLGQAIARRLCTPAGALAAIGDDPDYGFDIRELLNDDLTEREISALGPRLESEVRKEERILGAEVAFLYSFASYQLAVDFNLDTQEGPFRLVLGITDRSVEVINAGLSTGLGA